MFICPIQSKHTAHNWKSMNYSAPFGIIIMLATVLLRVFTKPGSTLQESHEAIRAIQGVSGEITEQSRLLYVA